MGLGDLEGHDPGRRRVLAGVDGGQNVRERGTGTIVDDDAHPAGLTGSDATVVEGDAGSRSLVVPIALSSPPGTDVTVRWSTVADLVLGATASAGVDPVSAVLADAGLGTRARARVATWLTRQRHDTTTVARAWLVRVATCADLARHTALVQGDALIESFEAEMNLENFQGSAS